MADLRSNRADVRNPMVGDPEVMAEWEALLREHPAAAQALLRMLRRLSRRWRAQGEHAWAKHKGIIAWYHKANAVNARHLAVAGDHVAALLANGREPPDRPARKEDSAGLGLPRERQRG